jgi:malate synthase
MTQGLVDSARQARISPAPDARAAHLLSAEAVEFLVELNQRFDDRRRALLHARELRQARIDAGRAPTFLPETKAVREASWTVSAPPADLRNRRVEITGPTDRKMMINALNSGAQVFMADFEDANVPTWRNLLEGQANLYDAARGKLSVDTPDGRHYEVGPDCAALVVRPRGWHLDEVHLEVGGRATSASLFDFGLHAFHNARELLRHGRGPYFYLPKMESHLEARLWNDAFAFTEDWLNLGPNAIRATVLIETLPAAFEMDEILYELRSRSVALNAGRWDYIFSVIKTFRSRPRFVLPDRTELTMNAPFMWSYAELLVKTCHARGAYAIGGMAAYVPDRRDEARNRIALGHVRKDKLREAGQGFDGTWVAHPDLVPVAAEAFGEIMGDAPHQLSRLRRNVRVDAANLLYMDLPSCAVTEAGLRSNLRVSIAYLAAWLDGVGAVAIDSLMEDTATAEIARAQVWQWLRQGVVLEDGKTITPAVVRSVAASERARLEGELAGAPARRRRLAQASRLVEDLVLAPTCTDFIPSAIGRHLESPSRPTGGAAA